MSTRNQYKIIRFLGMGALAHLSPISRVERHALSLTLSAISLSFCYDWLFEDIGYGAAVAIAAGAILLHQLLQPVLRGLFGSLVYRDLRALYGDSEAELYLKQYQSLVAPAVSTLAIHQNRPESEGERA